MKRLHAHNFRELMSQAELVALRKAFPHPADTAAVTDGDDDDIGYIPVHLLADFIRDSLFTLNKVRVDRAAPVIPAVFICRLEAKLHRLIISTVD